MKCAFCICLFIRIKQVQKRHSHTLPNRYENITGNSRMIAAHRLLRMLEMLDFQKIKHIAETIYDEIKST